MRHRFRRPTSAHQPHRALGGDSVWGSAFRCPNGTAFVTVNGEDSSIYLSNVSHGLAEIRFFVVFKHCKTKWIIDWSHIKIQSQSKSLLGKSFDRNELGLGRGQHHHGMEAQQGEKSSIIPWGWMSCNVGRLPGGPEGRSSNYWLERAEIQSSRS